MMCFQSSLDSFLCFFAQSNRAFFCFRVRYGTFQAFQQWIPSSARVSWTVVVKRAGPTHLPSSQSGNHRLFLLSFTRAHLTCGVTFLGLPERVRLCVVPVLQYFIQRLVADFLLMPYFLPATQTSMPFSIAPMNWFFVGESNIVLVQAICR